MNWIQDTIALHRNAPEQADIYGVVLYTESHPHVVKLLNDDTYWDALDRWSGQRWSVFATKAKQGAVELPEMPQGSFGYLVPVWKEPFENEQLLEFFELETTKDLPLLLIFSISHEGDVLKTALKIADSSVEEAYETLRSALSSVSEALSKVHDENLKNTYGVYAAVSLTISDERTWSNVKNGLNIWRWLKSVGI